MGLKHIYPNLSTYDYAKAQDESTYLRASLTLAQFITAKPSSTTLGAATSRSLTTEEASNITSESKKRKATELTTSIAQTKSHLLFRPTQLKREHPPQVTVKKTSQD